MKRVFIIICLISSLSACASMNGKDSNPDRNKFAQTSENKSDLDEQYIAEVESVARTRGVLVKWVNPPKAKKPKKSGQ